MTADNNEQSIHLPEELVFVIRDGDHYHIAPVVWSIDATKDIDGGRILRSAIEDAAARKATSVAAPVTMTALRGQMVRPGPSPDGGG